MVLFYFPPPKNRDPTNSAQKENKKKKHTTYVHVNPGFTAWIWSLRASTYMGRLGWCILRQKVKWEWGKHRCALKQLSMSIRKISTKDPYSRFLKMLYRCEESRK